MTRAAEEERADASPPWYADGLRFQCTACGACCTGPPGYVWIDADDVRRMARALGMSRRRFRRRYVRAAKGRLSLREKDDGDCVFLAEGRCTLYAAKPTRCSTFPFWPEVLGDEQEWEDTAGRCEGIGQGALYAREEIERLLAGDPRPLLERQADPSGNGRDEATPDWDGAFAALERLYEELDRELPRYRFSCAASGRCCDFDAQGHRLYATTLEVEYFFRRAPDELPAGSDRHCPAWGADRLCRSRASRMLGCRTYFCGPYPVAPPDEIHERYLRRVKALHDRYGIPFAYRDIVEWARERP